MTAIGGLGATMISKLANIADTVVCLLALISVARPATASLAAADPLAGLAFVGEGRVSRVDEGGVLVLDQDRRAVLAGIEIPRRPLDLPKDAAWPAASQAEAAITRLSGTGPLRLYGESMGGDRYGRLLVHAVTADGSWLQGALLAAGWARVSTTPDCRAAAASMLSIEADSRRARRGLWALPAYAVRRPWEATRLVDSVQIVEGRVSSAKTVKGALYVEFGARGRRGFSVRVPRPVLARFGAVPAVDALIRTPPSLTGHWLRVRGWIGKEAGPFIELSHPEQLELADFGPSAKRAWAGREERQ